MTVRIDGRTKLAGVVGWPIAHSLSPAMHNAAYEAMGLDWVYIPLPLGDEYALEQFVAAARVLPFVGFNITMPHKRAMLDLCDEVSPFAQLAGAVNTVQCVDGRLRGYNTDGRGLLEALANEAGFTPEGRRVVLLGSGGAAGGALVSLVLAKAESITVAARTPQTAQTLLDGLEDQLRGTEVAALPIHDAEEAVSEADLVINGTPIGMGGDTGTPVPRSWLRAGQVVADMVYDPVDTPLLQAAREVGATPVGGLGMLVGQGAIAIETWLGGDVPAPRDVMRRAAEDALAEQTARAEVGSR